MAKIINSDAELRLLVPNQLVTIRDETPLFDKPAPFLALAEAWVRFAPPVFRNRKDAPDHFF